jgi:GT2 family glycosyltransferase
MKRNIGVIVVSYHNPDMTTRYVTVELSKLTTSYTLVVVNVAATKEESKQLAENCGLCLVDEKYEQSDSPKGYLIWDEENIGYSRGNNKGVRFLNTIGTFTHYLFSNDDIKIIDVNILHILVNCIDKHKEAACVGPRVVGLNGQDQSPHDIYISPYRLIAWKLLPFLRRRKSKTEGFTDQSIPFSRYTYWVCGAFMLVDAQCFLKVGMFDEATFLYFEEVILSERLAKIKKKMYYESSVQVIHYEGGSSEKSTQIKRKHEKESRTYYYKKYKHIKSLIVYICNLIYR